MANQWGAFRARFTPIKDERVEEIRSSLVCHLGGEEIPSHDRDTLVRWKYIDQSGLVTRMGHEFLEQEKKMEQWLAKYGPDGR